MKKKISLIILLVVISLSVYLLPKNKTKSTMSLLNENMLSFTVDGVESKTMPTKGSGYIASKITCTNGSIITFDNDNYTIEAEKLESEDVCKIDFSKEEGNNTITVTTSDTSKIDSTSKTTTNNGKITFYVSREIESVTGCNNTVDDNKIIVNNVISTTTCNVKFKYNTLYSQLLSDNPTRSTRSNNNNGTNDFAKPLTTTTTGTLFTSTESITGITDSPKEVYYYAGNTTNNWVKFANLYWRIIRTNHDGSIRLLYVGTSHDTTSGNIGTSKFNTSYNSPKYVGYKYGEDTSLDTIRNNTTDSTIKTFIDTWYQNNLTNYTKYLSTSAVYCNDRSEGTGQTYNYASSPSSKFYFAPYYRMDYATKGASANPSYNCSDIRDAFSVDNTSAKLDYPVSLMTADEITFAGGVTSQKMSTPYAWFISNSTGSQVSTIWWSLSPIGWEGSYARVWYWHSGGLYLYNSPVYKYNAVRPAISLKSCTKYSSGDGTPENPYTIEETETGC